MRENEANVVIYFSYFTIVDRLECRAISPHCHLLRCCVAFGVMNNMILPATRPKVAPQSTKALRHGFDRFHFRSIVFVERLACRPLTIIACHAKQLLPRIVQPNRCRCQFGTKFVIRCNANCVAFAWNRIAIEMVSVKCAPTSNPFAFIMPPTTTLRFSANIL